MAAIGVEVAHHQYRATLAAGGVKHGKLPQPLQIPRPTPWQPSVDDTATPRQSRTAGRRHASTPAEVVAVLAHGIRR